MGFKGVNCYVSSIDVIKHGRSICTEIGLQEQYIQDHSLCGWRIASEEHTTVTLQH